MKRLALLVALCVPACRQDMFNQPRYKPLAQSGFFGDARSARPLIPGTVARGYLRPDEPLYTGKSNGQLVATVPVLVNRDVLLRGEQRFNIFCSPCHGRDGYGSGMVVQRGYRAPPSFHIDRLRQAPDGYFFDVVTKGFGVMPSYAPQIPMMDRWAITAYIRALQLSQNARLSDVPPEEQQKLKASP